MIRSNIIGVALCGLLFLGTFIITGNAMSFLNIQAFVVVLSGTFAAALLSYPYDQIKTAYFVAKGAYQHPGTDPDAVIHVLLDMAIRSRVDGLQSMEKAAEQTTMFFLRDALRMLSDNYPEDDIREILYSEITFFKLRRKQNERIFRSMSCYAPAFGLAGSVIGLIGLLIGLGDTGEVLKYIPIALISTLYGILFGNFILSPVAENIRAKTEREILLQKVILEGVCAIKSETNPHILEKRLSSFLTPAARKETHETFAETRKRYVQLVRSRQQAEPPPQTPGAGK